jgi:hypothetical protein
LITRNFTLHFYASEIISAIVGFLIKTRALSEYAEYGISYISAKGIPFINRAAFAPNKRAFVRVHCSLEI